MRRILVSLVVAACCWLSPAATSAAPFHYNADWQTFPFGSLQLLGASGAFNSGLNQWTFSGSVRNGGVQTYQDVLFLISFVYDATSGLSFDDATDTWSGNGHSMSFPALPVFPMLDTDAPTSFIAQTPTPRLGLLDPLRGDSVPYVQIGDVLPGQIVPFSFVGQVNQLFVPLNLIGSFVSITPIPEPSSITLLGAGAAGLYAWRRARARRCSAR